MIRVAHASPTSLCSSARDFRADHTGAPLGCCGESNSGTALNGFRGGKDPDSGDLILRARINPALLSLMATPESGRARRLAGPRDVVTPFAHHPQPACFDCFN